MQVCRCGLSPKKREQEIDIDGECEKHERVSVLLSRQLPGWDREIDEIFSLPQSVH